MALAEATHHTAPRGQKTARARGEERDELYDAKGLMTPRPSWPTPLVQVRPQGRVLRHAVEGLGEFAPMVQILDAPVPQMDYVAEALRLLDRPIAEQLIEVPPVSCSPCPSFSCSCSAVSGTVGGSADHSDSNAHRLADRGADRWHSTLCLWSLFKVFLQNRVRRSGLLRRSLTFLFLVVVFLTVLKVLSQNREPLSFVRDRDQQLLVPSSSPTLFLLEVLTVFSQDRVQQLVLELMPVVEVFRALSQDRVQQCLLELSLVLAVKGLAQERVQQRFVDAGLLERSSRSLTLPGVRASSSPRQRRPSWLVEATSGSPRPTWGALSQVTTSRSPLGSCPLVGGKRSTWRSCKG